VSALARLFVAASVATCSKGSPPAAIAVDRPLVGTWRALEYVDPRANDAAQANPLGRPPRAYLVYDRTGHVFFQAVHGLAANADVRGRWRVADSASLNHLLSDAAAYFGTYTADYARGTVGHHIEGEISAE
jgi:hypothetical protein